MPSDRSMIPSNLSYLSHPSDHMADGVTTAVVDSPATDVPTNVPTVAPTNVHSSTIRLALDTRSR